MKLWDSLTTCLILLSATVHASSLLRSTKRRGRAAEGPLELPPVQISLSLTSPAISRARADTADWEETLAGGENYASVVYMEEPPQEEFEDVVDFIRVTISRIRRSSSSIMSSSTSSPTTLSPSIEDLSSRARHRRERKKGASHQSRTGGRLGATGGGTGRKVRGGRTNGRRQGCMLKQIQLNVTDLGLGYRSSEEMIFRYCSGPCRKSETNYDKILYNLAHNRRLPPKDMPPQACCRPIAYDDDLSFLDDNLVYHTVRKHSARKCGCV
ncbi:LOW QUALITY PROTEIN: glial cell line-derived neurotrophic factor-like [Tautogolabrus adspersus]